MTGGQLPDLERPLDARDYLDHRPGCEIDQRPIDSTIASQLARGVYVGPCGCRQKPRLEAVKCG